MRSKSTSRWLRPAIGLIAAYAIALQAILAGLVPLAAGGIADQAIVICHGAVVADEGPSDPSDGHADHRGQIGHCLLCTISPLLVRAPAELARPVTHAIQLAAPRPAPLALRHDIHAHPGRPRDPPMSA
jgi:hypothetical protein